MITKADLLASGWEYVKEHKVYIHNALTTGPGYKIYDGIKQARQAEAERRKKWS